MARTINMLEAINEALSQEMERDERVFILGEDIGLSGGVFKVTDGLLDKFGEERVLDTPLAEGIIIAAALTLSRPPWSRSSSRRQNCATAARAATPAR
jgi:pyruvate/2-oxoglutarate/acetoin dehydrogenase E1 component